MMLRLHAMAARLRGFLPDRTGTGTIEFAIIAPILIMTYLGAFQISVGFDVARRVAHASSTVADLLAQGKTVDTATLDGMKTVALSVMAPYSVGTYTLKTTGIKVTAAGTGVVLWSRDQAGGTPYPVGSAVTIPSDLSVVGSFLVSAEMTLRYNLMLFGPPGSTQNSYQSVPISKTYYFRQRVGSEITCTDCPLI